MATSMKIMLWVAGYILLGLLLLFGIRYIVINKYRNLTPQKITQLRGDASLLIAENLNTNKQYWSENEPGFPVSFRELGAVSAGVNDRWPGAVNITTSLGFSHRGLFIIVSPTSFSLAKRSELPPLKEVGDNVYEWNE